jgi:repressor LexA
MALTRRQRQVLEVIRAFIERNGYSPSLEEIGAALGLSSVATVHKHVSLLIEKGYAQRTWNQNRSIELTNADPSPALRLPVRGIVRRGRAIEPSHPSDTVCVPADMVRDRVACCVVRVADDGMHSEQICDGDCLVIETGRPERDGEIVLIRAPGGGVHLARVSHEGGRLILDGARAGAGAPPAVRDDVQIEGVAVGVLRRY